MGGGKRKKTHPVRPWKSAASTAPTTFASSRWASRARALYSQRQLQHGRQCSFRSAHAHRKPAGRADWASSGWGVHVHDAGRRAEQDDAGAASGMLMRRMRRLRGKVGFEDLTYRARMKQRARDSEERERGGHALPGFVASFSLLARFSRAPLRSPDPSAASGTWLTSMVLKL
jgi:hypothetical protein